ncbi:MAG: YihY/virulence factor BrkB family protein [Planctomycetales bacterium]|nr:YihY/virulence factor BrkB family protein [Planctomycetales bacterium]
MRFLRTSWAVLLKTFGEFASDNCMRMAAALSYYAIFSLPAIMAIVVSIAGTFFGADEVRQRFVTEARDVVGQNGAEQLETMIEHANRDDRGMFGTIGSVAILVFAATGVMSQLQSALNDAWDVRPTTDKSKVVYFFVKRAISLLMIAGIALVLSVSIVASAVLTALQDQIGAMLPGPAWHVAILLGNDLLGLLLQTVSFALMYRFLPDTEVPWRGVWLGAALTAVLFTVGRWLLGTYLSHSNLATAYGAAGSLALIMAWVYYSGIIFLFGAEFTQVWTRRRAE